MQTSFSPLRIRFFGLVFGLLFMVSLFPHISFAGDDQEFVYRSAPTMSLVRYQTVLCQAHSPMCNEASSLYQIVVNAGLDPALELAHAAKESSFGSAGIGRPASSGGQYNAHGVRCNDWDGGGCQGRFSVYQDYGHSVHAWTVLMTSRGVYVDAGYTTLERVVPIYCPPTECDVEQYIAQLRGWIRMWRGQHRPSDAIVPVLPAQPLRDPSGRLLGVALLSPQWITGMWIIPIQITNYRPQTVTLQNDGVVLIDTHGRQYRLGDVKLAAGETIRLVVRSVAARDGLQLVVQTADDPVLVLPVHSNV